MSEAQTLSRTPVSSGAEQSQVRGSGLVDEAERVARALNDSLPSVASAQDNDNKSVIVPAQAQGEASVADNPPPSSSPPPPTEEKPVAEKPAAEAINNTRAFSGEDYLAISDELARQRARVQDADEQYGATILPDKQQDVDLRALAAQVRIEMQAKERARNEEAKKAQGQPPEQAQHKPLEPAQGAQSKPPARAQDVPARAQGARQREVLFALFNDGNDNSAMRFVLIAIVLFVAFLLILLFSHILR
jgi:hypothetical protein